MRFQARSAKREDFESFYRAGASAGAVRRALRDIEEPGWLALLGSETAISVVVEDCDREPRCIVGCAQAAFIHPWLARRLRAGASPWVDAHLCAPPEGFPPPQLSVPQLAQANTRGILSGLITRWHIALGKVGPDEAIVVRQEMRQWFERFTRGHNFHQIFIEVHGAGARSEAKRAGFRLVDDYSWYFARHGAPLPRAVRPCLLGLTREQAREDGSSLISYSFAYTPPRFGFSAADRETLQHAVSGADDKALMRLCHLSKDGVKSRWKGIFDRVQAVDRALLPIKAGHGRGQEKRGVLIEYLQRHPEELRPHLPPSGSST